MSGNPTELLRFAKIRDYEKRYRADIHDDLYFGFPVKAILDAESALFSGQRAIAYFSMEYGLATNIYNVFQSNLPAHPANRLSENEIFSNDRISDYLFSLKIDASLDLPTYSGGLGVLAGDTVKTAADLKMPMAAIGILWNKGYFRQRFWFKFGQFPEEMKWEPASLPGLIPLENKICLELKNQRIYLRLWKYYVYSRRKDFAVPLVLLDSNVEENDVYTKKLTDRLYKSDDLDGRLLQRLILGMGGIMAIEELGYRVSLHHLNEGHAAFAFVQKVKGLGADAYAAVRKLFAYTCHTPVPAGHDRFSAGDVERILKSEDADVVKRFGLEDGDRGTVNLTLLAMNTSGSVNAVSKKHGEVMRLQFPAYRDRIKHVTNGVHFPTWISEPVHKVLEDYSHIIGSFKDDATVLKNVLALKDDRAFRGALWQAHQENKKRLGRLLERWKLRDDCLTLCWARRIAAYKRPGLLLRDIQRLARMAAEIGPLQILYAGKAHPNDNLAFTEINAIMNAIDKADGRECLKIIMLENYDIYTAQILVSCVDIWLNNPLPPYEASGTSGMKAIANGVLQLSTRDGWVLEAADKKIGKFFGYQDEGRAFSEGLDLRLTEDSQALYDALDYLMRLYYAAGKNDGDPAACGWVDMMINCIAEAGYFNTLRMMREYRKEIWGL